MSSDLPDRPSKEGHDSRGLTDSQLESYIAEVEHLRERSALALAVAQLSHRRGGNEQAWHGVISEMQTVRDACIRAFERLQLKANARHDGAARKSTR